MRVAVVAGGGDLEQQRLAAGAGRGLEHVDHVAGPMRVQLVDDRAVHVQAVHGAAVGGQRHEAGGGRGDVQVVDQDADPALERRRRADHALGLVEHDARLIAGGGGGVDLGAVFAVGDQQIQADAGRERALAVLPRHGAVGGAEAPEPVDALPAEQAADHEGLPGREREGLARPTRPWNGAGSRRTSIAWRAAAVSNRSPRAAAEARSSRWRSQARRTRRFVRNCPSATARA